MVSIMQLKMVKIYFIPWIEEIYHSLVTEIDYGCQQDPKEVYQLHLVWDSNVHEMGKDPPSPAEADSNVNEKYGVVCSRE